MRNIGTIQCTTPWAVPVVVGVDTVYVHTNIVQITEEINGRVSDNLWSCDEIQYTKDEYILVQNQLIEDNALTSNIAFVTLAEAGTIDGTTAGEHIDLFGDWTSPIAYAVGNIRVYGQKLYQCITAHTSQADWTPDVSPSLWVEIADPSEEWPAWNQPIGSMDTYSAGDKASHNEANWVSDLDNNVWEPGVYGWTEYSEGEVN